MGPSANEPRRFDTLAIHSGREPQSWEGALLPPMFQTASRFHPTAESLSRTFAGETINLFPNLRATCGIFQIRSLEPLLHLERP